MQSALILADAFADHYMSDSAQRYLNRLEDSTLSNNQQIYKVLIQSKIWYSVNKERAVIETTDSLYRLISAKEIETDLRRKVLDHLVLTMSYYMECELGLNYSNDFVNFLSQYGPEKDLMWALMMKLRFNHCLDVNEDSNIIAQLHVVFDQNDTLIAYYHELLGDNLYAEDYVISAFREYLIAHNYYAIAKKKAGESRMNEYLADVYMSVRNYARSVEYLELSKDFAEKNYTPINLADYYNNLGWSLYRIHDFKNALDNLMKSKALYENKLPTNMDIAYPIGNLGLVHRKLGNYQLAVSYSKQANKLFGELGYLGGVAEAMNNIAYVFLDSGQVDSAVYYFKLGLDLAMQYDDLYEELNAHKGLYQLYKTSSSSKALQHLESFIECDSKYQNVEQSIASLGVEMSFIDERNELKIAELEAEKSLRESKIAREKWKVAIYAFAFLIAMLGCVALAIMWTSKRKLSSELTRSNQQNERIIRMISHDFRGPVGNIRILLDMLIAGDITEEEFKEHALMLQQQIGEITSLFDSFVGWAVSQSGGYQLKVEPITVNLVLDQVSNLLRPMAKSKNINLVRSVKEEVLIYTDKDALALILRNVLSNAIKFSPKDSSVVVNFEQKDNKAMISVIDEGAGLSEIEICQLRDRLNDGSESFRSNTGLGLLMANDYAGYIGGSMDFIKHENGGLEVQIIIPIEL